MAPGYRNNTQSRRQNRGLVDHDIFEGLPVRNWRRDIVVVAPPPAHDALNQTKDKWDMELPWGMPKDAHLMPQHSQDLLRAARSGRIYQKRPLMEEDQDDDVLQADKPEKKEVEPKDDGFTVKTWKLVPKHLEGPEFEYLAKRRKGLRGAVVKGAAQGPTMTKMTVRKTDDQGNAYIEHVVVPEGQAVEGEVITQVVVTDAAAAMGADGQPQHVKRRPPPPKRKAKGPGRGRKKKVMLPPTSVPTEAGAATADGMAPPPPKTEGAVGEDGVKQESTATPSADNEDTEMGDGSQAASDDEGDEGEEGSEDDDQEEGEIMESPGPDDQERAREDEEADARARANERERERVLNANNTIEHKLPAKPAISDFPMDSPGGFPNQRISQVRDTQGSPLKNTFTPRSYSPSVHNPEDEAEGDDDEDEEPHNGRPSHRGSPFVPQPEGEQLYEPPHHPEILPNMGGMLVEALRGGGEAEGEFQNMMADDSPSTTMLLDEGDSQDTLPAVQPTDDVAEDAPDFMEAPDQLMDDGEIREDENFEDLLGGLEDTLNEHEMAAAAGLEESNDLPEVQPDIQAEAVEEATEEEKTAASPAVLDDREDVPLSPEKASLVPDVVQDDAQNAEAEVHSAEVEPDIQAPLQKQEQEADLEPADVGQIPTPEKEDAEKDTATNDA